MTVHLTALSLKRINTRANEFPDIVHEDSDQTIGNALLKARNGDLEAFDKIVHRYQSYAFSLAFRILCDEEEAKDVTQESFIRVWKHIGRYDAGQKFTTWLCTIVTNLCRDRIRATKRRRVLFGARIGADAAERIPGELDPGRSQSNRELAGIIRQVSDGLPARQRLIFTLRDLQDLSVDEVVEITGLTRESVKTNLHYARRRIRRVLEEQYKLKEA